MAIGSSYQTGFCFKSYQSSFCLQGAFTFDFFPLKVGTTQGKLEFTSNDLGLYIYDLEAKATSGGPERALHFKTCLGTSQTQFAKFLNYTKHKTDYTCKVKYTFLTFRLVFNSRIKLYHQSYKLCYGEQSWSSGGQCMYKETLFNGCILILQVPFRQILNA